MSSLPSFVELMSSLGLEDGSPISCNAPSFLRPRSHSDASSSSGIDDEREPSPQQHANTGAYLFVPADHDRRNFIDVDVDVPRVSRQGKGRYSPYSFDAIPRKGSLPSLFESRKAKRTPSTSPLPSPRSRAARPSRASPSRRSSRRGSDSWLHEDASTPISTFLRRKTPQMSPTSAAFPRSALDEPLAPVAIPALPPLLSSFVFPQRASQPSSPSGDLEPQQVLVATTAAEAK
ncbi:hypothetical protein F5148DRAFT_577936 [Russula earlei]|uniref:Uncharacterized protein n=1 Tax=Russula earlei TaxID=71964 RepID=A0ACC0UH45_9AGAM|nr:hypothetical protein F5148DRAFT_577936 [Russula earlei]